MTFQGRSKSNSNKNTSARSSKSNNSRPSKPTSNNRNEGRQKKKLASSIDPRMLVKKAVPLNEKVYVSERTYDDFAIHSKLKLALKAKKFLKPTEIQDKSIEYIMDGRDVLGIAKTGTGKTGAFLIPFIDRWLNDKSFLQVLVVVPTRELALQVEEEFKSLTKGFNFNSACFIGGTNINTDYLKLKKQLHLIVGTPGRLRDLSNRNELHLKNIEVFILDEFDRMLDMGFAQDIKYITSKMVKRKQTLLYSATLDKSQQSMINALLNDPVEVKVSTGEATSDHIEQKIIEVGRNEDKFSILLSMLQQEHFDKVIIFTETKRGVQMLCEKLSKAKLKVDQIHGNKTQNYREKALQKFKKGEVQILIATDVAARGLDISDVTHVINYQLPMTMDSYIHRIGRTGRAGKGGTAYTFVD
jgi:ATP-dependent RNA helicase RhlE